MSTHSEVTHKVGLMVVQELSELEDFIRMLKINGVIEQSLSKDKPINAPAIQKEFAKVGEHLENLLQLRWLDEAGYERVRVDVKSGRSFIISDDKLQFKGDRYYFTEGMQITTPHAYLSPIDLNVEHGEIVVPFEPTIRITLQTEDEHNLREGLLIVNYNLGPLLGRLAALSNEETVIEITNEQGYWLVNPESSKSWGLDLDKPEHNLSLEFPELWHAMAETDFSFGKTLDSRLVSFQRDQLSSSGVVMPDRKINIVVSTSPAILAALQHATLMPALIVGAVILVLGLGFVVRDYYGRIAIFRLSNSLAHERDSLKQVNQQLDSKLHQINLLQDDLAEAKRLSSLGVMVAGISHEMNTPVGGAMLTVSEIRHQYQQLQRALSSGLTRKALDDFMLRVGHSIELSERNLEQANNVIQSFKRLTLTRVQDEFSQVSLQQLVDDIVVGLMSYIKKSHVVVVNDIGKDVVLLTQSGILSQVLQNLLTNALEHGFGEKLNGHIHLQYSASEHHHHITVIDDGCGIPEALLSTIFDPFVTGNRGKQHSGLGLHLVHQWVTQCLYGDIKAERLTLGSRFTINLPKDPLSNTASSAPSTLSQAFSGNISAAYKKPH
ncbi:HAMP domain-containing histidine kinase [Shewanella avicenniae]|uniref:histidine kinase n=1 Tax=Shewanella avicenniae TaxID=2814294 RepID=A0ABX7QKU0_9GAMM|nr:HAMP domain-containing sensor histidine kinase [Shewanella avicenniae]QSX32072.1 HAMP domain-containing histidine kinase [Shewanella avicenniae]